MRGGIYTIRFKGVDKFYVGKAKNLVARQHDHIWSLRNKRHHNKHLQAVFDSLGEDFYEFTVEVESDDANERTRLEQAWIDTHFDGGNLFNFAKHSVVVSYEKKRGKRVAWNKGVPSPFKGIPRPAAIGEKISATKKGKPMNERQLAALVENRKKIDHKKPKGPRSHEQRMRQSQRQLGKKTGPRSEQGKANMRAGRVGIVFTPEHIQHIGEANRRRAAERRTAV